MSDAYRVGRRFPATPTVLEETPPAQCRIKPI